MKYSLWLFNGLAIFLSLSLAACTNVNTPPLASPQVTETVAQSSPSTNSNKESVQRIVALSSLTADIIYRLDETKLVGMPGSRLFGEDKKFEKIPRVSEGRTQPNLEKIVALRPDLVVGAAGFHDQTAQKLKELGINTLLTNVDNWQSLEEVTKTLAQSIGANPELLLKKYQSLLDQKPIASPSTLVLASRQPILSPNKDSWCGDMLTQFKVKNSSADLQGESPMKGYIPLSAEKILQVNPEMILVVETGDNILNQFQSQPFWNKLKAVENKRVYVFEYYGLVNPGSIDAIEKASIKLKQVLSEKGGD
ncbi:ABC transporter substrate-binding protein [Tychonema sp. LEGE 07203]|uniref:ABC transporter substrate-binding protein n=1 Tax=Tychonema sp. LEGE 07203 TaxID=1828671 RepID=UPI0018806595|nr:ABC transporter substrate-binding protein [Tychonema sp. LEGE 07203]MBE9093220.1 ABC transporter substrate-binding protein [Tychonema sp. LEGE 07203]